MIRVAAVGDLMLGDSSITVGFGVRSRYPGGQLSRAFAELAPRLAAAELAIGNLECPLTPIGLGDSRWARDQMRGDEAYARVLRNVGFNAISVANNHAMQHDDDGFERTVTALRSAGLLVLGLRGTAPWHGEPVAFRGPHGESVALLAYSGRPRQYGKGPTPYADLQPTAVLADVTRARAAFDSVIVSLHWGEEFVETPSMNDIRFAHALSDHGADLVLGHHPHVVRPLEAWGTAVIAYSLGNCVTDMLWLDQLRKGALLETELSPRPTSTRMTYTIVDDEYVVRIGDVAPPPRSNVTGLEQLAYESACDIGLRTQRAAAYRYLARNLRHYPPSVLASLIGVTATNKWRALMNRSGRGSR